MRIKSANLKNDFFVLEFCGFSNHSKQHMTVCGLSLISQGSTECRKTLEHKFIFKSAPLILTVSTNAFHSTNLLRCLPMEVHFTKLSENIQIFENFLPEISFPLYFLPRNFDANSAGLNSCVMKQL